MTQHINVVIGGGLYGCAVALRLAEHGEPVMLVERESELLTHASYNNQARVHGGYHYPRNRLTGRRSRVNIARFEDEFGFCVSRPNASLYAIARIGSKVTPQQFEEFCADIGTPLYRADLQHVALFDSHLVSAVYRVEEPVFDAALLRENMKRQLAVMGVDVRLQHQVMSCSRSGRGIDVSIRDLGQNAGVSILAKRVFNCTYSCLAGIRISSEPLKTELKHEITEMALVEMPPALQNIGITIMDGDFWSALPFPDRGLHTLSHVDYTPHISWMDNREEDPHLFLARYREKTPSRGPRMILDAARYVPMMAECRQADSLWEVKTVLMKNEQNDGRPILLERHAGLPMWSILGGKVDNVFDLLQRIDTEILLHRADNSAALVLV